MEKVPLDAEVYAKVLEGKLQQEMIRSSQMESLYLATKKELDALKADKAKEGKADEAKTAQ